MREVTSSLGIPTSRANEAASHVWPDCVDEKEFKEYSFALKEWRRERREEPYLPPRITPLTKKHVENDLEYGKVCYWD